MVSVNDFKTGLTIEVDGEIFTVIDFQHVKPGKGAAFVRSKLRNLRNGNIVERTFRAGEDVDRAHVENRTMQYLYNSGDEYTFMDNETYDQITLNRSQIEWELNFLLENMNVQIASYRKFFGINCRNSVELKVVETEPGVKGNTDRRNEKCQAGNGTKRAVSLFINEGDVLSDRYSRR